jgi:hypothetical protein
MSKNYNLEFSIICNEFLKDHIVCENNEKIILHTSNTEIINFNSYAKKSLEIDNDAKRRSRDEAISIHIITEKLNTHLNILYEAQISAFYGKPDFIIRLGKKLFIMVSTTRAVCYRKSYKFTQKEADRLMQKKISGLSICKNNLECLVDEVITNDYLIRPILHILSPNIKNAFMCINAYNKIIKSKDIDLTKIKIIISCINNHKNLL